MTLFSSAQRWCGLTIESKRINQIKFFLINLNLVQARKSVGDIGSSVKSLAKYTFL